MIRGYQMKRLLLLLLAALVWSGMVSAYAAAPEIEFSHASGFYDEPFALEIRCSSRKAVIYYTLDGSVPDENSLVYEGGLNLLQSNAREDVLTGTKGISEKEIVPAVDFPTAHVIRAVAITRNGDKSEVISGTYFVGYDRQELYGDTALMLLVTDPRNFFDDATGIYVLGDVFTAWRAEQTEGYDTWNVEANFTQRGKAWERPVSVTFLPADREGFTQEMGVRIKGNASRSNSQKSLRLIARDEYGRKNVKYELYPDNVCEADGGIVAKYKSFTLRTGGDEKIYDPLISDLAAGLRMDTAQNMPCIAFINGEYWGMYTLNEEYSDNYVQYHYGIDNDNVVTVKVGKIEDGNEEDISLYKEMFDFIAGNDMSDPAMYQQAETMLDMGSFADYCALQFYIINEDGPFKNNNWQMWRARKPEAGVHPFADGVWRMMLFDTDYTAGVYSKGGNADTDNVTPVITRTNYNGRLLGRLLTALNQNADFKRELVRACCDVRNLYFDKARVSALLAEMGAEYAPYVPDTMRRFGPEWTLWDPDKQFEKTLGYVERFFTERHDRFLPIIQNAFGLNETCTVTILISDSAKGQVYINRRTIPAESGAEYCYFPEYGLTITAVPAKGAVFTGWTVSGDHAAVADPNALTTEVSFSQAFTLTANFE